MVLLGYLQLILIVIIILLEYKRKSPIVFLWATLFVMFGIMHLISYYLPDYQYEDVLDEASLFVVLFCVVYLPIRIIGMKLIVQQIRVVDLSCSEGKIMYYGKCILFISVVIYAYYVVRTSGSFLSVSKDNVYKTMADGGLIFLLCTYMYYASAPLLVYCIIKKRKKDAIYIAILVIIRSLLSSSRMDMIILFVGLIAYIIFCNNRKDNKKIVLLGIVGVVALVAIYALRTFRYYYSFSDITEIDFGEFGDRLVNFIKTDDGELGLRRVFYHFIENNNEFSGFGNGAGYARVLLLPFPSSLLNGVKPEDMCIVMGRAWKPYFQGIITYTVTPTLFGDCYANFGFEGFLLGGFWAIIASFMDYIINRKNEVIRFLLWGLVATEFIDIGRGSIYNPLVHIWYCGIMISVVYLARRISQRSLNIKLL